MNFIGYIDEVTRFHVAGWVADQDDWTKNLNIDIIVNGSGEGECVADCFRQSLDELHPQAHGRYAFRFYFDDPLSLFSEHDVRVRVSGTTYFLTRDYPPLASIERDRNTSACRPSGPVLLSTMGRTGSTAIMALLAQHPNIVVAGERPYEVEMGCYYSYALRTLLANGDHTRSLRTDDITHTANRFHIGFNPYFEPSFVNVFKNPLVLQKYLTSRLPARVGSAFREIILDYYEELAKDRGTDHPIYFAEKSLPERDSRLGIRFMFPNLKEIVLVRDLRDVVCSSASSNGLSFNRIIEDVEIAARQTVAILEEDRPSILLLRYEDIILNRKKALSNVFNFLGLATIAEDDQSLGQLFASHATSVNPAASIGRWKRDLTPDQKENCERLRPLLDRLGYLT